MKRNISAELDRPGSVPDALPIRPPGGWGKRVSLAENGRLVAKLWHAGKGWHCGTFDTLDEARAALDEKRKKLETLDHDAA